MQAQPWCGGHSPAGGAPTASSTSGFVILQRSAHRAPPGPPPDAETSSCRRYVLPSLSRDRLASTSSRRDAIPASGANGEADPERRQAPWGRNGGRRSRHVLRRDANERRANGLETRLRRYLRRSRRPVFVGREFISRRKPNLNAGRLGLTNTNRLRRPEAATRAASTVPPNGHGGSRQVINWDWADM